MNRRRFLGIVATATLFRPASAQVTINGAHPKNPADLLLRDIEPGQDDFPLEKEALEIAARLRSLIQTRSLPLAQDFRGVSPLAKAWAPVSEGVATAQFDHSDADFEAGLKNWLDGLGQIRAARFFVLPENIIRYEVASEGNYRLGRWSLQWSAGRLTHFSPVEETLVTAPRPLFEDITDRAFLGVDSFERQLARDHRRGAQELLCCDPALGQRQTGEAAQIRGTLCRELAGQFGSRSIASACCSLCEREERACVGIGLELAQNLAGVLVIAAIEVGDALFHGAGWSNFAFGRFLQFVNLGAFPLCIGRTRPALRYTSIRL
jgi:hypothetical protein